MKELLLVYKLDVYMDGISNYSIFKFVLLYTFKKDNPIKNLWTKLDF